MIRYFIADPSYVFGTEKYKSLCEDLDTADYYRDHSSDLHLFKTKFGDGLYPIFKGEEKVGELFVDTGMLCCAPVELIKKEVSGPFENLLIFYVDLQDKSQVRFKYCGDLQVGDYFVNTSNEDTVSAKFYKEHVKEGQEDVELGFDASPYLVNEILKEIMD